MGWMSFNFVCETCKKNFETLVKKEYGVDGYEMPECPDQKEKGKKHKVVKGVTVFSGVYDVGFFGKSRRMKK